MASSEDGGASPRRSLAEVAGEFAAGQATPHELHEAFLSATVFCEAGERPGFVAVGRPVMASSRCSAQSATWPEPGER